MPRGWNSLPPEMNLSVLNLLSLGDLKAFSAVDQLCRQLALPTLFKSVKLDGYEAVESFLSRFPSRSRISIRSLHVSTRPNQLEQQHPPASSQTDLLVALLSTCTIIQSLTLQVNGPLQKHIIPPFARLVHLTSLSIENVASEALTPLSERSVVSIAASVPHLQRLSLDGITRSLVHAPELLARYPFAPLVVGDEDIEPHPVLGSDLSLPSLLRIPTLQRLQLSETHLGDRLWGTTPSSSNLQVLDLGAYSQSDPEFNMICAERIINNVARSSPIRELFVSTPLQDGMFKNPFSTPLRLLEHVHLMPLLPVDRVVETLFTLSGSPVHTISVEGYEEDGLEVCCALEDFLTLVLQHPDVAFYQGLKVMNLNFVPYDPLHPTSEHNESLGRLMTLCETMGLSGEMPPLVSEPSGEEPRDRFGRKAWRNSG